METPHMSTSVTDNLKTTTATPDDAPLPGAAAAEAPAPQAAGDDRVARFIDISSLEKTFSGDGAPVLALRSLDLTVAEGTFLGVMGQSGSGKSTFLSILGGLTHPTAGSISVDGSDLYKRSRPSTLMLPAVGWVRPPR